MAIEIKHLNHIYGQGTIFEQYALKDVNLTIHDGEFIGLIGHTGSGKSTLTQHLNGLLKATSGDILYNGESIYKEGYSMKELRSHVGLVFQYPEHQLFEVDVFSDVCFGPKNLGLPKEEIEKRAKEALDMVGLDESFYKQSPFDLSGGQKRRVAIAGVLAMKPEVLILRARHHNSACLTQHGGCGTICVTSCSHEPRREGLRRDPEGSIPPL